MSPRRFSAIRIALSFALGAFLFLFNCVYFQTRRGVLHRTFSFVDIAVIAGRFVGALSCWFIVGPLGSIGPHTYLAALGIHAFLYRLFAAKPQQPIYLNQKLIETDRVWNTEAATDEPVL